METQRMKQIWSEIYASHGLANKFGRLSFGFALDDAVIVAMRHAYESGLRESENELASTPGGIR